MPEDPVPTEKRPIRLDLEPGAYFWCACGKTSHTPFCDGSHKGSGIQPRKFEVAEKSALSLCQCKATKNPPFCDGSHRDL
ncbi:CDGSH iron-sulfur domain-containing protein [Akkermansiaceae bacterium]|nr:CDGSH iron-sulfur domain-containing protein [Akkermansiaceae bacterium]